MADIRRVARLVCHSPSSVEYARDGRYDVSTVRRRFGGSWGEIVGAAGLRYTPRTTVKIATAEELRRDLLRVARGPARAPTCAEYEARGSFGSGR